MGAHVASASRTAIGVAAANRKEPRRDGYLRKLVWKITREFYGFRENRDFLELISDFRVAVLGKIPDLAILAKIDQK